MTAGVGELNGSMGRFRDELAARARTCGPVFRSFYLVLLEAPELESTFRMLRIRQLAGSGPSQERGVHLPSGLPGGAVAG